MRWRASPELKNSRPLPASQTARQEMMSRDLSAWRPRGSIREPSDCSRKQAPSLRSAGGSVLTPAKRTATGSKSMNRSRSAPSNGSCPTRTSRLRRLTSQKSKGRDAKKSLSSAQVPPGLQQPISWPRTDTRPRCLKSCLSPAA